MRNILLLLCFASVLFGSCYEPKEGCLDIEAVNFDASADKNCCCEYPVLLLEILQRYDTDVWLADSAYQNSNGQWFRLKSAVFYLSEFQLYRSGVPFLVSDTLMCRTLESNGDSLDRQFTDDFMIIRRFPAIDTAGSFRNGGSFDAVRCRLGIGPEAQKILPSTVPAGHPLRPQTEKLWLGNQDGFAAMRLVVTRDTFSATPPDTLYFNRQDFDNFMIEENATFKQQTGYNMKLRLTIDYSEMFRDVDWQNSDKNAWKSQIVANLPGVFHVSQ